MPEAPPLACSLDPAARAERRRMILAEWVAQATSIRACADGYELRFAASAAREAEIDRIVALESECCSFLRFDRTCSDPSGEIRLTVRGPLGAKELLDGIFARSASSP